MADLLRLGSLWEQQESEAEAERFLGSDSLLLTGSFAVALIGGSRARAHILYVYLGFVEKVTHSRMVTHTHTHTHPHPHTHTHTHI